MQDDTRIVADVFAEEQGKLHQLPGDSYPAYERKSASVGRTPWVRFDKNDYSLPPQFVRMRVDVLAYHRHVRIVVDGTEVARHMRSFDRRRSVEVPAHTDELSVFKRKAHVLTTNRPIAEWNQVFESAACLTTLIDRLCHRVEIIKIDGDFYRQTEGTLRAKEKRAARKKRSMRHKK